MVDGYAGGEMGRRKRGRMRRMRRRRDGVWRTRPRKAVDKIKERESEEDQKR